MIVKERSQEDKRQIWISFDLKNAELYKTQHDRIIKLVDTIIDRVGEEQAAQSVQLINTLADAAEDVINDFKPIQQCDTE